MANGDFVLGYQHLLHDEPDDALPFGDVQSFGGRAQPRQKAGQRLGDPGIEYGVGPPFTVSSIIIAGQPVSDSVLVKLDAFVPRGSVFDLGGTTFTADATSESSPAGAYSWPLPAGLAWVHGQDVTVSLKLGNFAATVAPGISGTAQVGQELTATTGGISDRGGNTKAENGDTGYAYAYQWIRVDGSTETSIMGETAKTYTLAAADEGKKVKVKVMSFKGDRDNAEGPFTSDAYPAGSATIAPRQRRGTADEQRVSGERRERRPAAG